MTVAAPSDRSGVAEPMPIGANIRRSGGDFVAPEFFPEGLSADPQNFSRLSHLAFSLTHHLRQIFALGSG